MLIVVLAAVLALQDAHTHPAPPATVGVLEVAKRPVSLRNGIGFAHDAVATRVREAQALYDQGLAYLHSYVWLEAARSFNTALSLDPTLAIAHVGLSIAYTELNAPAEARAALDRAKALPSAGHDKRHIGLRALQADAEATHDAGKLSAYRAALDEATAAFPKDEELWLARGQAESPDPAERGQGSVIGAERFYQKALALGPGHFAPHHYLAHAYENSGRIADALGEATTYAKMAPGVPHAHHMHGHDLRRAGRIEEAIVEFQAADRLATTYFASERVPAAFDWHYQHNLDLLATSFQYTGRMAQAEALLKQSFAMPSALVEQEFNKREWPVFLIARGRAKDALEAANVMAGHRSSVVAATGHVMAGEAQLALGDPKAASDEANAALRLMRNAEGGGMAATPLQQLQGEFFLRTGQREKGRTTLQAVVKSVRGAPGPDAWAQALFTLEAIARTARDVGDWEFAAWAASQMIEHDPAYAGSHLASALVAQHRGEKAKAAAAFAEARKRWSHADPGLPELAMGK